MSDVKIWHNPRCKVSRAGLKYLQEKGIEPDIFNYLKEGFAPDELARIIKMTGQPLDVFIRKNEADYRTLDLKNRDLTVDEFAKIAAEHPKLLHRPIVIKGENAVLAQPASKIDEIL